MLKRSKVSILMILVGMLGCDRIQPRDISGTWVIADNSRRVLPAELQRASSRIILNGDGSFVASELPGLFYSPRLESGTGTWKRTSEGNEKIQLNFQTIAAWKEALPYGTQLNVSDGSLYYFLGDPDEGRRVSFEKR
jgi:hypothetical protein